MKIMIVDDSTAMRMMVKRMLKRAGFGGHEVIEAEDGVDALTKIKDVSPQLVLSDWNMPNMTGIELLKAVKEENIELDFGFVTTESTQDMRESASQAGAQFLLTKPFTEDSMSETLEPFIK